MRSLSKTLALALLAAALTACGSTATAVVPSTLTTTVTAATSMQMPTTVPTATKLPTIVPTKTAAPTAVATMLPTEATTEEIDMAATDNASTSDAEATTDMAAADAASTVEAHAADAAATMEELTTTMDASAAPSAEGQATADTQAVCTSPLITTDEVEQILGKLDGAPSAMTDDTTGVASCGYSAAAALMSIDSSKGDAAKLQELVQLMKQYGAPLQAVKGLGDAAYSAVAPMQGVPNKTAMQGVLMARKGQNILVITMLSNVNEAKTTAALHALALKALLRMQ